jgi:hypothetical protein
MSNVETPLSSYSYTPMENKEPSCLSFSNINFPFVYSTDIGDPILLISEFLIGL